MRQQKLTIALTDVNSYQQRNWTLDELSPSDDNNTSGSRDSHQHRNNFRSSLKAVSAAFF